MIIRRPPDIPSSEITPESVYVDRRRFIRAAALAAGGAAIGPAGLNALAEEPRQEVPPRFAGMKSEQDEELNTYEQITTYNNFYEFGTRKEDPHRNSGSFRPSTRSRTSSAPRPWRTASTACAAWKPGRWSSPGTASRWRT
jgi:sulfoxide reductase catalytic subunit YedY